MGGKSLVQTSVKYVSEQGYTLLELLVAVAILAMLSVPIAASLDLGLTSWSSMHDEAERRERVFLSEQRLRYWIESAYPIDISRHELNGEVQMIGGSTQLEFSTAANPDPMNDALYRLRLRFEGEELQAAMVPDFDYLRDEVEWRWFTVLDGVEQIAFEYLEGFDVEEEAVWVNAWGSGYQANTLPLAVRIEVTLGSTAVPEMITVPIVIEQQAYCVPLPEGDGQCQPGADVG